VPIRYILDTDTVTYQQLGRELVLRHLSQTPSDEIATTVVTMYEQLRGRLAAVNRQQTALQLQRAFHHLRATQLYYCQVPVLLFDESAQAHYEDLLKQKIRIGTQDLRIAAIALSERAVLVTSNQRHFGEVPGLRLEDWNQ
jgi:tRNA(fMet)-specific endonuclease VapC